MDWYALGVLIFEMLSGLPPFHEPDISPVVLYEKIAQGPACIKWPAFNAHATDLILKFMERDPSKRFGNLAHGAGDVFAHPWFAEVDWKKLLNREITAPYLPKIANDGDASAYVWFRSRWVVVVDTELGCRGPAGSSDTQKKTPRRGTARSPRTTRGETRFEYIVQIPFL